LFEENYSMGRGVVFYSEEDTSRTYIYNSTFRNNYGFQGGVIFTYNQAYLRAENCLFE
jgi:hypothetical protein